MSSGTVRKYLRLYFLFHFILAVPVSSYSQNYTIKTFTTDNGLSHNSVRAMASDSTGFMWFGTWDGLSRFDGYEFKNYFHIPGDSTSLQYFSVKSLCVDGSDNLWILSISDELTYFNRSNETFIDLSIPGSRKNRRIFSIDVDKKGDLWVICSDSVFRRDHINGRIETFRITKENGYPDFSETGLEGISFDDDGSLWLFGRTIFKFVKDTTGDGEIGLRIGDSYRLNANIDNAWFTFDRLLQWELITSESGEKYIFSNTGLYLLDEPAKTFETFAGRIDTISFKKGTYGSWAETYTGIFVLNKDSGDFSKINPAENTIADHLFMQKSGIVWFSTFNSSGVPLGLSMAIPTPSHFRNYLGEVKESQIPAVFPITEDKYGNILAGIRGIDGIVLISPDGKIGRLGKIPPDIAQTGGHVRALVPVPDGIWIGYFQNVLLFYDYNTKAFIRHYAGENIYRTIAVDNKGKVYIGNNNLTVYDPVTRESRLLWTQPGYSVFYKLFFDENGILWGGLGESLLLRYDPATGSSKLFKIIPREVYHIEDICSSDSGKLWLALLGGGLSEFDPASGSIKFYTSADGLANNTTYSILKDKKGNLWISTDNGISRFNPKTALFRNFDRNDGLGISEFNSDASYISRTGEFFLGGMGGFVGFRPEDIEKNDSLSCRSKIILSDLIVSGSSKKLERPLNSMDTVHLEKGENNFRLIFSITDFINADKIQFRYRMTDISTDWSFIDHRNRNINFSNLKPGNYHLDIEATNSRGEWSVTKSLVIILKPYFYQTTLFFILTGAFLFVVIYLILSLYMRQFRNRERLATDQLRLQALRGQMNPHFIFNSLNSINYFISGNDQLSANRYIADFARLIRNILSNMGSDFVRLTDETDSLRNYLEIEFLRFGDRFDYKLDFSRIEEAETMMVTPGLIQPFVENAIWHGIRNLENRKAMINIKLIMEEKERLKCIVEDDGIGRKKSANMNNRVDNHKSRGIAIVNERLQIISKMRGKIYGCKITDLYPESEDTGTRVEIDIPVK
jgi:streptogramin lyase